MSCNTFKIPGIQGVGGGDGPKKAQQHVDANAQGSIEFNILEAIDADALWDETTVHIRRADSHNIYCEVLHNIDGKYLFTEPIPGTNLKNIVFRLNKRDCKLRRGDYRIDTYINKVRTSKWISVHGTYDYDVYDESEWNPLDSHLWDDIVITWDDLATGGAYAATWDDLL